MTRIRLVALTAAVVVVSGLLAGCGPSSWCAPLEPTPTITAQFRATTDALSGIPGVRSATPRFFQPDDSHCVSRESLRTAPWSADYDVHVAAGLDSSDLALVRSTLKGSTGTITASAGKGISAWSLDMSREAPPATPPRGTDAPPAPRSDAERFSLVAEAAGLPAVTWADLGANGVSVRVSRPEDMIGVLGWLRRASGPQYKWLGVGSRSSSRMSVDVSDAGGVSDATLVTAAAFLTAHPRASRINVSSGYVGGVLPTKAQACAFVTAFEETPADSDNQTVSAFWPDGHGTSEEGTVGSSVAG